MTSNIQMMLWTVCCLKCAISMNRDQSKFLEDSSLEDKLCLQAVTLFEGATSSARQCVLLCSRFPDEDCKVAQFVNATSMCYGCSTRNISMMVDYDTISFRRDVPSVYEYLVSGPNGIPDEQLSASSSFVFYYSHGPERARLNTPRDSSGIGAWSTTGSGQYIQADFGRSRYIVGCVTQGRHPDEHNRQWVTSFKVSTSTSCENYDMYTMKNNTDQVFSGNNDTDTIVINMLDIPLYARCVRLHPITWYDCPSMRFDILGV